MMIVPTLLMAGSSTNNQTIEAHGTGKGYTLEAIVEVAEEVIKSVREEESTVRPNDPSNISLLSGHYTAFSIYPQATAYA